MLYFFKNFFLTQLRTSEFCLCTHYIWSLSHPGHPFWDLCAWLAENSFTCKYFAGSHTHVAREKKREIKIQLNRIFLPLIDVLAGLTKRLTDNCEMK